MTAFRSRWDDWEPKGPSPRTDKSDKIPFVTFGTSSPRPISEKNSHSDPEVDVHRSRKDLKKRLLHELTELTKASYRPLN